MKLDSMRIRVALMGAGLVTLLIFLAMGGRLWTNDGVLQVEFGMYPDDFIGATVEVDGEAAGTLEPFGGSYRSGFALAEGPHDVRIVHGRYQSDVRRVDMTAGGTQMLILNFESRYDDSGNDRIVIGFEN